MTPDRSTQHTTSCASVVLNATERCGVDASRAIEQASRVTRSLWRAAQVFAKSSTTVAWTSGSPEPCSQTDNVDPMYVDAEPQFRTCQKQP